MGFRVPIWVLGSPWDVKGPHMGFGVPIWDVKGPHMGFRVAIWDLGSPHGIWDPYGM